MPILSLITWLPLAGGIAILLVPKEQKVAIRALAAVAAGLAFVASLWLWAQFNSGTTDWQFIEKASWIPGLGIHYFLALDGISLPMVVLTTFLTLLALIGSFHID